MSADGALNATGYIRHHLANLASAHQSSIVDFSVINYDTLFFSIAIMGLTLWLLYKAAHKATAGVPGKFQCAIEMLVEFVNDQAKTLYCSSRADRLHLGHADELHRPSPCRSDPDDRWLAWF